MSGGAQKFKPSIRTAALGVALAAAASVQAAGAEIRRPPPLHWVTVVNNGNYMPAADCDAFAPGPPAPTCRRFNSYNQPSVNARGLVVMRARSRGLPGGGMGLHGVYSRDMAVEGPVVRILDRMSPVPQPNNLGTRFTEPPAFPRIDIDSDTVATRGNHPPVWRAGSEPDGVEQLGTSGIYANPFGPLIAGTTKLGTVPEFSFFQVPERPGTMFDVYPGAPAVGGRNVIVFKGNYTDADGAARTGVYSRQLADTPLTGPAGELLEPAGGTNGITLIANNSQTLIPGTAVVFGSTSPPSAAAGKAVFSGFDNEENPTLGGIYLANLKGRGARLKTLVSIGSRVPADAGLPAPANFSRLGEGVSYDGRFVAFWGAWGTDLNTLVLRCPQQGNKARRAFCAEQYPDGLAVQVPANQGMFVYDAEKETIRTLAIAPRDYKDFLFWNFSGRVPGTGHGEDGGADMDGGESDGELARWRASTFIAVSGAVDGRLDDPMFHAVFKARSGEISGGEYASKVDGLYLAKSLNAGVQVAQLIETGADATVLDHEAIDPATGLPLIVTELGIERDGFRGAFVAITARMGPEDSGWAGVYLLQLPRKY